MQRQLASFVASHGGAIDVTDEDTMVPVIQMDSLFTPVADPTEKKSSDTKKGTKPAKPVHRLETPRRPADKNQQLNSFE